MKTINEIRDILCDEIDRIRAGKTTPANVNAVVNATGKILTTIKMEIEYAKANGKVPNLPFIQLTSPKVSPPGDKPLKVVNKEERKTA